jgi:hypothetical protein
MYRAAVDKMKCVQFKALTLHTICKLSHIVYSNNLNYTVSLYIKQVVRIITFSFQKRWIRLVFHERFSSAAVCRATWSFISLNGQTCKSVRCRNSSAAVSRATWSFISLNGQTCKSVHCRNSSAAVSRATWSFISLNGQTCKSVRCRNSSAAVKVTALQMLPAAADYAALLEEAVENLRLFFTSGCTSHLF